MAAQLKTKQNNFCVFKEFVYCMISGFQILVSGFWLLVPDSRFHSLGFRVTPFLSVFALHWPDLY